MVAAFPPIPDGACISDIATDMTDVLLSTAAGLLPCSKRPRRAQGWRAGPGVEAKMNVEWQQREEARRHLRAEPHSSNLRKAVKMDGKSFRMVRKAAVLSLYYRDFSRTASKKFLRLYTDYERGVKQSIKEQTVKRHVLSMSELLRKHIRACLSKRFV